MKQQPFSIYCEKFALDAWKAAFYSRSCANILKEERCIPVGLSEAVREATGACPRYGRPRSSLEY
jgi:hypothetical protein